MLMKKSSWQWIVALIFILFVLNQAGFKGFMAIVPIGIDEVKYDSAENLFYVDAKIQPGNINSDYILSKTKTYDGLKTKDVHISADVNYPICEYAVHKKSGTIEVIPSAVCANCPYSGEFRMRALDIDCEHNQGRGSEVLCYGDCINKLRNLGYTIPGFTVCPTVYIPHKSAGTLGTLFPPQMLTNLEFYVDKQLVNEFTWNGISTEWVLTDDIRVELMDYGFTGAVCPSEKQGVVISTICGGSSPCIKIFDNEQDLTSKAISFSEIGLTPTYLLKEDDYKKAVDYGPTPFMKEYGTDTEAGVVREYDYVIHYNFNKSHNINALFKIDADAVLVGEQGGKSKCHSTSFKMRGQANEYVRVDVKATNIGEHTGTFKVKMECPSIIRFKDNANLHIIHEIEPDATAIASFYLWGTMNEGDQDKCTIKVWDTNNEAENTASICEASYEVLTPCDIVCPSGYYLNTVTCECIEIPPELCDENQYWSEKLQRCMCNDGFIWSEAQGKCVRETEEFEIDWTLLLIIAGALILMLALGGKKGPSYAELGHFR